MTRIDFHSHVANPLDYACRLARKVYQAGQPLVVLASSALLTALDQHLWTFSPLDFVPHCMSDSALAAQTPVLLCTSLDHAAHHRILLNLTRAVPPRFARFERLLEIVSDDPEDLAAGRDRYRFYRDRGYPLSIYRQGA